MTSKVGSCHRLMSQLSQLISSGFCNLFFLSFRFRNRGRSANKIKGSVIRSNISNCISTIVIFMFGGLSLIIFCKKYFSPVGLECLKRFFFFLVQMSRTICLFWWKCKSSGRHQVWLCKSSNKLRRAG